MGRATQGVKLINLGKRNDQIASVCKVLSEKEEDEEIENIELSENPDVINNNEVSDDETKSEE